MQAVVAEGEGLPLKLARVARPIAAPGQVLIRVAASGVNPLDLKIRAGLAPHARHPLPAILGLDLAGTVEALGAGVSRFNLGDEVYGMVGGVGGIPGTLAEFVAGDADSLAPKPVNLSMREAAVLPLAAITAWEGLVDRMHVGEGDTLLIQGGAGGVGHVAAQLARGFGAQVYATGGRASRATIERLGVTFIDREEPWADYVRRETAGRGFKLVFDTAGGHALDASFAAVGIFGHVASTLGWGTHALAPLSFKGGTYSGIFTLMPLLTGTGRGHHGEILRRVARIVEAGKLVPLLDAERFDLSSVGEAHRKLSERRNGGKLAVDVAPT